MASLQTHVPPTTVRCDAHSPLKARSSAPILVSRRGLGIATGLSICLQLSQQSANAAGRDVPLFGIRRRTAPSPAIEKNNDVKKDEEQASKEENKEVLAAINVAQAVFPGGTSNAPPTPDTVSPGFQAGAVLAAEVLGVAVASTIVSGLVSQPSTK